MKNNLSIIIPAYNEEESLKLYLPKLINFCELNKFQLIIVDDGSKDKTLDLCNMYADTSEIINVVSHKVNKGYGGAIKTGIETATTKYIITIDADGQHNFKDVENLYKEIQLSNADMIVGSRESYKDKSKFRGFGKKIIRGFANLLMKIEVYDINSGMKIYRTELAIKYINLCPDGMSYSDTILLVFINFRHKVLEIPISINDRISGVSTIGAMTAIETIREIFNIIILFNPLKVFVPVSIFIFVLSLIWGIPLVLEGSGVSVGTLLGLMTSFLVFSIGFIAEQISQIRKNQIK